MTNRLWTAAFAGPLMGVLLALFACSTTGSVSPPARLPIIQGATGPESTELAILLSTDATSYRWRLIEDGSSREIVPVSERREVYPRSQDSVVRIRFENLKPAQGYRLEVEETGGRIVDRRSLRTLDPGLKRPRILVASCLDDSLPDLQRQIWEEALSFRPNMIFLIGDTVYADREIGPYKGPAGPEVLWRRYAETRKAIDLFRASELIPVIATWDDHDYGQNDGDASFPWKEEARRVFNAYFPQEPIPGVLGRGPGVSSFLKAFGQRFAFMDSRFFRTKKRLWGKEQERWLWNQLGSGTEPVWLINGVQFYGGYAPQFESFQGNEPRNFKEVLGRLQRVPAPVFFVSGDRHLIELMKIPAADLGYTTFELTTSAIHAKVFPSVWDRFPNPHQIEGRANLHNYAIVESEVLSREELSLRIRGYGPGKEPIFDRDLKIVRAARF